MLYFRHILILLVSLYTVRVVLDALGVEDYGIYNVVGGIVSLFAFLSSSMASASQRFFSFSLGQNDLEKLKKVFSVNSIIYLGIALIVFFLLETIGLWFVIQFLKLPPERLDSSIFIYHFSVLTFVVNIIRSPFTAMITAHEDMQIYAYVSIVEAMMKLGIAFLLINLAGDKLEIYGVLLFIVSIISSAVFMVISFQKYKECQFKRFYWDREVFKEIFGFTTWTLFGQISNVFRNQAITILINQFFNPVVVAGKAIATNITSQINVFSNNFNVGLYPPIIKSYAANEKANMFSLIFNGSKITFFLMWIFALPMFIEMNTILNVWLKNPPPEAVLFTRLALIELLIHSISLPLGTAARAPGKMKFYELTLGSIQILIFIVSWIVLKLGAEAYSIYIVAIMANLAMFMIRLFIVSNLIDLSVKFFLKEVAFPVLGVIIFSMIPSYGIHYYLPEGIGFSGLSVFTSLVITTIVMYYIGLDKIWREKIQVFAFKKIRN
ncbi:polysaccharide biosynthesis protein [Cyclobacteriaceae bacterium YHN15]|nr:polysaccharide biosynthesis protein [Cyclobacteriaceae bacterium YHN15]